MAWTVDPSLNVLLGQINAAAPNRDRSSDGSIGDATHQASTSDHNPEYPAPAGNPPNEVDARDFTHDPRYPGSDMHRVTEAIRLSRDPRVAYVIWDRRIYSGAAGPSPWTWRPYSGDNPHDKHAHVSVRDVNRGTQPWSISTGDDMSERASRVIEAWAVGLPRTSAGEVVSPVDWRIRDERWQAKVEAALTALSAAVADLNTAAEPAPISDEQLERVLRKVLGMTPAPE